MEIKNAYVIMKWDTILIRIIESKDRNFLKLFEVPRSGIMEVENKRFLNLSLTKFVTASSSAQILEAQETYAGME
jgi:hypothetical protein